MPDTFDDLLPERPSRAMDELPPNSGEAEQGVLACILIDPLTSIPDCLERLNRGAEMFYDLRYRTLYETLLELYEDQTGIDLITLQDRLRTWGTLDQVGGISFLAGLQDLVPSAHNLESYLDIVRAKYLLRETLKACTQIAVNVKGNVGSVDAILDQVESEMLRISQARVANRSRTTLELVRAAMDSIEAWTERDGALRGISTGFYDLDRLTGGLHGGDMIVLAGRPGTGKTSLAMNVAEKVAVEAHLPVGVFSLEMTAEALIERMLLSRARVNIRYGFDKDRDVPKITSVTHAVMHAPLHIDDQGGITIIQLRAKARRWMQQHQIRLLIIDYLQLITTTDSGRRYENRTQEVGQISHGIKNLAKELNIPVIILAQLNREFEKEKKRKPRMADLRESGDIEQDADMIGFLYSPEKEENPVGIEDVSLSVSLLIAKQRNGPTGEIPLVFRKSLTRFENASRVSQGELVA